MHSKINSYDFLGSALCSTTWPLHSHFASYTYVASLLLRITAVQTSVVAAMHSIYLLRTSWMHAECACKQVTSKACT